MEKAIIFDSGTLISFSMNGITEIIRDLKKIFGGKFLITHEIKGEIIDRPLNIKRFELEALKMKQMLDDKIIELPECLGIGKDEVSKKAEEILNIANETFHNGDKNIHIMDLGEASGLALSNILKERKIQNVIAIDERTTRILTEKPENLRKLLERKIHVGIEIRKDNLSVFKNFKIIRSAELIYVAYKKRVLQYKDKEALDALLYALKFKGAAISDEEIKEIKKLAR